MSPGAAAGPSLLPHTRDTTRGDIQESQGRGGDHTSVTFSPSQQGLLQAAQEHLGCAEGEHPKLCPSLLCSPPAQLELKQDGAAAELRAREITGFLLWGRGSSSKLSL